MTEDPFAVRRWLVAFEGSATKECFELPLRYKVNEEEKGLGQGAYGSVCQAFDEVTQTHVAIKKLKGVFDPRNPQMTKSTVREIKLLQHFSTKTKSPEGYHPNILRVLDIFVSLDGDVTPQTTKKELEEKIKSFNDVYIVLEKYDMSLKDLINAKSALEESQRAYFTYQMLKGMKAIFSANVMHRDMKPENLLIRTESCELVICDFGSGRGFDAKKEQHATVMSFTTTQWYRPPESFLEDLTREPDAELQSGEGFVLPQTRMELSQALDMWSCGAILGEMMQGKPLCAAAGNDILGQLNTIFTTIAPLTEDMLKEVKLPQQMVALLQPTIGAGRNADLKKMLTGQKGLDGEDFCAEEIDILAEMMKIQAGERISIGKALQCDYFSQYELPDAESEFEAEEFKWRWDECKDDPRGAIWEEVCSFNQGLNEAVKRRLAAET